MQDWHGGGAGLMKEAGRGWGSQKPQERRAFLLLKMKFRAIHWDPPLHFLGTC